MVKFIFLIIIVLKLHINSKLTIEKKINKPMNFITEIDFDNKSKITAHYFKPFMKSNTVRSVF